ncbi:hypothetical protein [Virgibacillus dakarensis]|uniref:hypothetical protein n=1 Tax=Virgibacillus dakarensis TaxID=1917889 RepID=UPI000B447D97|nr:hypothetical protein [Virgibacillus dakarensis]
MQSNGLMLNVLTTIGGALACADDCFLTNLLHNKDSRFSLKVHNKWIRDQCPNNKSNQTIKLQAGGEFELADWLNQLKSCIGCTNNDIKAPTAKLPILDPNKDLYDIYQKVMYYVRPEKIQ